MFQKLFKTVATAAIALALFAPAPLMAQEGTTVDDPVLYETQTPDEELIYQTQDYDYNWDTLTDDYTTTSTELSDDEAAALAGFALFVTGIGLMISLVVMLVGYVYSSLVFMVVAQKVNEEPAWLAWVPIANLYLIAKIAQLNPLLMLLFFLPFVNIILGLYVMMKIAERRGFPSWVGLLVIVPLVGIVIPGYIAWGEPTKV